MSNNPGAFKASLKRTNRQIRDDRADAIGKSARLKFKRKIEDLDFEVDEVFTDRENILDMSPTNAQSLIVASDFKADEYIIKEEEFARKIRDLIIIRNLLAKRFTILFGEEIEMLSEETIEPVIKV